MAQVTLDRPISLTDTDYYSEPTATFLEALREAARAKSRASSRLTYDCYNAVQRDGEVTCRLGHKFPTNKRGTVPLIRVLRGIRITACQKCRHFKK